MAFSELFQTYLNRLEEARIYYEQGLSDQAIEIVEQILTESRSAALPEPEKAQLIKEIESRFPQASKGGEARSADRAGSGEAADKLDPSQAFEYGMVLMDSQFWEEAIAEFKRAASGGYRVAECLERCGDCAVKLEKWDQAIRYYEAIYTNPKIPEGLKNKILLKITRCSQTQKKIAAKSSPYAAKQPGDQKESKARQEPKEIPEPARSKADLIVSSVASFDHSSIAQLLGQTVRSWQGAKGECLLEAPGAYKILNVVHIGITSQVVELEEEGSGRRFAGQILASAFNRSSDPGPFARWARSQMMLDSSHIVNIHDLGLIDGSFVIIREYLEKSLPELLSTGHYLPLPMAIFMAYRILEGLGDLHLHMGRDSQIRNLFHLDLRPSRILLKAQRPIVKISNGGLWRVIEGCNSEPASIRNLPLPFLAYRAPEQFRTYLARRRPPFFTDIYQFGILFYEMLTGICPFRAESFEEYEIQHCDQYPTPPKVWRPEIPTEINEIIMKCLEVDPMRRWRSVTQVSLNLEKAFGQEIQSARNSIYAQFMSRMDAG